MGSKINIIETKIWECEFNPLNNERYSCVYQVDGIKFKMDGIIEKGTTIEEVETIVKNENNSYLD